MSDKQPGRRQPFSGVAAPGRSGSRRGPAEVFAEPLDGRAVVMLIGRASDEAVSASLRQTLACELPTRPVVSAGDAVSVLWAGPGRWVIVSDAEQSGEALLERLAGVAEQKASLLDQSDGLALLRLSGPNVRDALAKGLPIDLHPRAFSTGDTAITAIAHVTAQIWQTSDAPVFELAVARSFAASFWNWLEHAAAEYGLETVAPRGVAG